METMQRHVQDTKIRFRQNIEKIATDLIAVYQLQFQAEVAHLSEPLARWMDFRLRYVDPVPRKIQVAKHFTTQLPPAVEAGLSTLAAKMMDGHDINSYQSKGLIRFNDSSGKKRAKRTDLLWASWAVTHLHITDLPVPEGGFFSPRRSSAGDEMLLFCIFTGDAVLLIDVADHKEEGLFEDQRLMRIVYDNWPEYMERFKLHGLLPSRQPFSNTECKAIWKSGGTTSLQFDDQVFMGPGMGLTTASTPLRVRRAMSELLWWAGSFAEFACDPEEPLITAVRAFGIDAPAFDLCMTPRGLAVAEQSGRLALTFPKGKTDPISIYCERMENLLFPSWALEKVLAVYPSLRDR